jgi:hypothetical protein
MRPYLKKTHHKKGLVEWLEVYSLSSSPGTTKKTNKQKKRIWVPFIFKIDYKMVNIGPYLSVLVIVM